MKYDRFLTIFPHLDPRPRMRELLWLREGKKCYWCKCATIMTDVHVVNQATVDHIIPRYKGGDSDPSNVVSACHRCNNRRNYEDIAGLPDGSLLGTYKAKTNWREASKTVKAARVALTAEEKDQITMNLGAARRLREQNKSLLAQSMILRSQRDEALNECVRLRDQHSKMYSQITSMGDLLQSMTVWKLIRQRLARCMYHG